MRKIADTVRAIWKLSNGYLVTRAPWTAIKTNPIEAAVTIRTAVNLIGICARAAWPIIPGTAETVLTAIGDLDGDVPAFPSKLDLLRIPDGRRIKNPGPLFEKLGPDWAEQNRQRFGGEARQHQT